MKKRLRDYLLFPRHLATRRMEKAILDWEKQTAPIRKQQYTRILTNAEHWELQEAKLAVIEADPERRFRAIQTMIEIDSNKSVGPAISELCQAAQGWNRNEVNRYSRHLLQLVVSLAS